MTLSELEADCYRRLGFASSPATDTTTRLRAFLNETQQEILSEPGIESALDDTITFASVASTPEYSLPPAIARVKFLRETTNDRPLYPLSQAEYESRYPDPTAVTGTPTHWVDLGLTALQTQPSDASEVFVISTSASDGAAVTAYLEGFRTGGYFSSLSVPMNGITAVTFVRTDFIRITKFYMSAAAVGTVTLREDSGIGTTLTTIPIGQTHARFRRIALVPCPAAAITYAVEFERDVISMANANDEPVLPVRFHRLLAMGARMKEYEKQDDQARFLMAKSEFDAGKKKFKFWLYSQSAGTPNLRGSQVQRPSRLGGWFESGT